MTDVEILHDNDWLSLKIVRAPEKGVNGYVYSHETRCKGRIVAVLPYMNLETGRFYLVRREITPCWSLELETSALTGGYEGGDIEDDAVREVLEEAGFVITRDDLISLGESYASKSSDTVYSLFAVQISPTSEWVKPSGDGSALEESGFCRWMHESELPTVRDPQVALMALRLAAIEW